jgi:hypothetical protein
MSAINTLYSLEQFCLDSSSLAERWQGNSAFYQWSKGKTTDEGIINGVVRKLAGTDTAGNEIWVVAGSFKIAANGEILRFTGISKKQWGIIQVLPAKDPIAA